MKMPSGKAKVKAFTLIELLVVIFILAGLAALLLPALTDRNHKGGSIARCMSNQKQIAIGLIMWKSDNGDQFPWKVAATNGGSMEAANRGYAAASFRCLSDYVRMPTLFVCPTDTNRSPAENYEKFRNLNISYFIAIDSCTNTANSILTGDRDLVNNSKPIEPGLFVYSTKSKMSWSRDLHNVNPRTTLGVISFGDGHAQVVGDADLNSFFLRENLATNRLCIP